MDIYEKLSQKGINIGVGPKPKGLYRPVIQIENKLLYTSGTGPRINEEPLYIGKVGEDVTLEEAQECARLCIINILGHLQTELGDLNRVERVVKILGFVASADDFYGQTQVLNAASELLYDIFGEDGIGTRSAIGVRCLPQNMPVEIEAVFYIHQ